MTSVQPAAPRGLAPKTAHVFVSYSRREFYFAESLALRLEAAGVDAWFDVHRLEPGVDWQQRIDEDLASASGLLLIASRASLASAYVAAEWQAALAAGKTIYVVLAEGVALPTELRVASVFDLRARFEAGARSLAAAVAAVGARPMRAWPTRLPRFPFAVAFVALGLLALAFLLLALGAAVLEELGGRDLTGRLGKVKFIALGTGLIWVILTGGTLYLLWGFARRRFERSSLLGWLAAAPLLLWSVYRPLGGLTDFLEHGGPLKLAMTGSNTYSETGTTPRVSSKALKGDGVGSGGLNSNR